MGERYWEARTDNGELLGRGREVPTYTEIQHAINLGYPRNVTFEYKRGEYPGDIPITVPEPGTLPEGLVVSEDGATLNWRGMNYTRQ